MQHFYSNRPFHPLFTAFAFLAIAIFTPQSTLAGEPDTTCFESIPVGFNNSLQNPTYFLIEDDIAYVIDDNRQLVIIDLSATGFYPIISTTQLQFPIVPSPTITLSEDRTALYIFSGSIRVYDISDITDPWFVRFYGIPLSSNTIPVKGDRLFVTHDFALGNARPRSLRLIHNGNLGEEVFEFIGNPLKIIDDILYTDTATTYDMTDPLNPTLLAENNLTINDDSYLFTNNAIYTFNHTFQNGPVLNIYNITNPGLILPVAEVNLNIEDIPTAFTVKNATILIADEFITAYDISNPLDPFFVNEYAGFNGLNNVAGMITIDGVIHTIDAQGNLTTFTLTSNPVATFATPGIALELKVLNDSNNPTPSGKDLALIADDLGGMHIYDITDPNNAKQLSTFPAQNTAIGIDATPSTAFIATHQAGLDIVDISDPANPTLLLNFDPGSSTQDVQVIDNYAYVVNRTKGLYILDISNPSNPIVLSITDTIGHADDITIHQHHTPGLTQTLALISHGDQDHYIIDVTNPLNPTIISTIPPVSGTSVTMTISMHNEYIYTADNQAGYRVFDASDLSNPFLVATVNTDLPETEDFAGMIGQPTQIQFGQGNTLIVANGTAGLAYYNNLELTNPILDRYRLVGTGTGNPTSSIRRFEIHENLLFTATRAGGFRIYDLYDCQIPCPIDFNADGSLNFFDLSIFLEAFNHQDPLADLNTDGIYNFFDISILFNFFTQGCP